MAARNFKLFLGCLGNGVTVCNSAVMEGGDFKICLLYTSDAADE